MASRPKRSVPSAATVRTSNAMANGEDGGGAAAAAAGVIATIAIAMVTQRPA